MHGKNPIRGPKKGDGQRLEVKEIFPTLQGEGPLAGMQAVFVRLGGCNLACDFCDTEFEDAPEMALADIVDAVKAARTEGAAPANLAVITGGEPLRQPIGPLCEALLAEGMRVQLETNGTLWRPLPEAVEVVCSPKNVGGGYAPLREDVLQRANALKFIVSATHPLYREVAEVGQARFSTPVYVQPMDEADPVKNEANHRHAERLAQAHGYEFSVQMHKYLGIR